MLSNALDIVGSLRFFVGFVCGALFHWALCRAGDWHHNRHCVDGPRQRTRIRSTWAAGGLLVAFVMYSAVSTYQSGERATEALARSEQVAADAVLTANENRECQRQFNGALATRSLITRQNDQESEIQREALAGWLRERLTPPADIRPLDPNNPVRMAWAESIERKYFGVIEASQQRQDQLDAERLLHPYPEPTCGR